MSSFRQLFLGAPPSGSLRRRALAGRLLLEQLLADPVLLALDDRLGRLRGEQLDGPHGVVVAGDGVVDVLGVAVRVDDGHDGDVHLPGLGDGDRLLRRVDDEDGPGQPGHGLQPAQVLLELPVDLLLLGLHLLRQEVPAAVLLHLLELLELVDARPDDAEVRQEPAEPALVDVARLALRGVVADDVLGLLLRADEEDHLAVLGHAPEVVQGLLEVLDRLLQVDDVDAVPLAEDVFLHLRVPALGLVPEVNARLQQFFHRNGNQLEPPLSACGTEEPCGRPAIRISSAL